MIGWAMAIALFINWLKAPVTYPYMLVASGLFAIAGSIGIGLGSIARKK